MYRSISYFVYSVRELESFYPKSIIDTDTPTSSRIERLTRYYPYHNKDTLLFDPSYPLVAALLHSSLFTIALHSTLSSQQFKNIIGSLTQLCNFTLKNRAKLWEKVIKFEPLIYHLCCR